MTDQEFRQKIERAADWKTSGIQEDPWLTQRVLNQVKEGERPMKKKLAFMPVLVFAIVAICAVALAATQLGLIANTAEQYQHQDADHSADIQVPELSIQPESDGNRRGSKGRRHRHQRGNRRDCAGIRRSVQDLSGRGLSSGHHHRVRGTQRD